MNTIEYYTRQNDGWEVKEVEQLKDEYCNKKLSIMEIGVIHRRTPGAIGYKLKSIQVIPTNRDARGYIDYTKSELYQSIVNTPKSKKIENTNTNQTEEISENSSKIQNKTIRQTRNDMTIRYENDIKEIKQEIKDLKESIKSLTEMLKSIYEFEES